MNETYQLKTIVLDKKPFREYDVKVTVFSLEKGKLDLVVRGAKRLKSKLAGHLESITLSNVMAIRGKQFDYAGSAWGANYFGGIRSDLNKLYSAGRAVMIFKTMIKGGERDGELFKLLEDFLEMLDSSELSVLSCQLSTNLFVLKLLVALGYKPRLFDCVVCKSKLSAGGNNFDFLRGGAVCQKCARLHHNNLLTISDNCLKVLRLAVSTDSNFQRLIKLNLNKKLFKEVIDIIGSFLKFHIEDRNINSLT